MNGPFFPQTLPPNTVVGRFGAGQTGPAQAVPFSAFSSSTVTLTRAAIPTTTVGSATIILSGFSVAGDLGCGAIYTSVGAGPSSPMAIQDLSGTWFQLVLLDFAKLGWFGAVGDGVTDDTAAINAALVIAAATGIKLLGSGKATYLISGSGIAADLKAIGGVDWCGATISYSGSSSAITLKTANTGNIFHSTAHSFENFILLGPSIASGVGISISTSGSIYAPTTCVQNAYIGTFYIGIIWENNAWSNGFYGVFIQGCTYGVYFPSGLTNAGERIDFYGSTIANCTTGIYIAAGELHFRGSLDYCTQFVSAHFGANVFIYGHIEGNSDSGFWLESDDDETSITIDNAVIAITGAKPSYPVGVCGGSQTSQINFGHVALENTAGWNTYNFTALVFGYGDPGHVTWTDVGLGAAPATISNVNVLVDGGFEKNSIYDWNDGGTTASTVTSSAPHSGTYCLEQNPASAHTCLLIKYVDCPVGTQPVVALWLKTAGLVADSVIITVQYLDDQGNGLTGTYAQTFTSANAPTSWTEVNVRPYFPAPPGTRYLAVSLYKGGNPGNSDGNGQVYYDDIIVQCASATPQQFTQFLQSATVPGLPGQMTIAATNNTTLTIKYMGSDFTVRSVALTIA